MKAICLIFILLMLVVPALRAGSATLENQDLRKYDYQIIIDEETLYFGTIYEQSSVYGICEYGCKLNLLETDQVITVNPEDHIIINGGVLKLKEKTAPAL